MHECFSYIIFKNSYASCFKICVDFFNIFPEKYMKPKLINTEEGGGSKIETLHILL